MCTGVEGQGWYFLSMQGLAVHLLPCAQSIIVWIRNVSPVGSCVFEHLVLSWWYYFGRIWDGHDVGPCCGSREAGLESSNLCLLWLSCFLVCHHEGRQPLHAPATHSCPFPTVMGYIFSNSDPQINPFSFKDCFRHFYHCNRKRNEQCPPWPALSSRDLWSSPTLASPQCLYATARSPFCMIYVVLKNLLSDPHTPNCTKWRLCF